jgi:hypothetical protein
VNNGSGRSIDRLPGWFSQPGAASSYFGVIGYDLQQAEGVGRVVEKQRGRVVVFEGAEIEVS